MVGISEPAYTTKTATRSQPVGCPPAPTGSSAATPVPAASTAAMHSAYRVIAWAPGATAVTSARMAANPAHAATCMTTTPTAISSDGSPAISPASTPTRSTISMPAAPRSSARPAKRRASQPVTGADSTTPTSIAAL